jgi:glycosyltransferase involved in cell wall biosynthesis
MKELRILACAFACSPSGNTRLGSGEAVLGWNLVIQLSRFHGIDVLTHPSNRPGIEGGLLRQSHPTVCFHYFELPRWLSVLQKLQGCFQIYAYLWQIQAYFVARRLHRQAQFDLFHHITYANDWAASFVGAFLPIPYLRGPCGGAQRTPTQYLSEYALHNRIWERLRRVMGWILRHDPVFIRSQTRARRILVCNRESLAALPESLQSKASLFPVNGISADDLAVMTRQDGSGTTVGGDAHVAHSDSKEFLVLSAGRLIALKGYRLAIKAFKLFAEQHNDVRLLLIGEGPDLDRLKAQVRSLDLGDRVSLPGWMPREAVLRTLAKCDVFLFPSFRDGGGAVIIEAMAAGKPVVCMDLAGPALHVTEECGIKVRSSSPGTTVEDFANALDRLYRNPELRLRMGKRARERVEQVYTWEHLGDRLRVIYDEVVAEDPGSDVAHAAETSGVGQRAGA